VSDRAYDLVVLGATGYTARLATAHLARTRPEGLRWALAGRSRERLEAERSRLAGIDPALADLAIEVIENTDDAGLAALAASTRVLVNATGPYLLLGEPVVRACAQAGTDYVDLTGEPEFVDRMYLAHHDLAISTGARLVHACGFDSVPHDLGARHAVTALAASGPVTLRGVVRASGGVSGGTLASILNMMNRLGDMRRANAEREAAEPVTARRGRGRTLRPGRDGDLGLWLLPLPTVDQQVIARSGAAGDEYGSDFVYSHAAGLQRPWTLVGALVGVTLMLGAAQVGPLRRLAASRLPQGAGPDEATRAAAGFTVDFLGSGDGRRVHTRVSGPDPYDLSGIALAESALCLAFDDNPVTAGQVTTAEAMGESLTSRLERVGVTFEVLQAG
jgi:short subunit dehydrogenase-like uncharacterized protein